MLTKQELDQRVALALGIPATRVSVVTDAFVDELCNALAQHGGFQLDGLGKLIPRIERGSRNIRKDESQDPMRITLYFRKSRLLKEQIERQFGVKGSHAETTDE